VPSDDAAIVRRCLSGDQRAYQELLRRYRRSVYSITLRMVGNREEAKDLAQEVFIRAFRSLRRYDPSRPFSSWIFKITSNLCIDYYRKKRLSTISIHETYAGDDDRPRVELADPSPGPDEVVARKGRKDRLELLLQALPPRYRIVVLLRHKEELSYEEIAEELRIPIGTVKARLHRAHRILRTRLLQDTEDAEEVP
jgi:RNA polymerase sigma-70 factor (ECF subfamily)